MCLLLKTNGIDNCLELGRNPQLSTISENSCLEVIIEGYKTLNFSKHNSTNNIF